MVFLKVINHIQNHKKNYPITNLINLHKKDITRIIPTNLEYIRLNTGLPVFVDWKTTPYKNDALIKWYERIKATIRFMVQQSLKIRNYFLPKLSMKKKLHMY